MNIKHYKVTIKELRKILDDYSEEHLDDKKLYKSKYNKQTLFNLVEQYCGAYTLADKVKENYEDEEYKLNYRQVQQENDNHDYED